MLDNLKQTTAITKTHLCVTPSKPINTVCHIPSSKPETQRAIIVASLAEGISYIKNDLRCLETTTMKNIMCAIGAQIIEHKGYLEITGTSGEIKYNNTVLDCLGSGLAFRVSAALTSTCKSPVVITGDKSLRPRVMKPLLDALVE
jgi:3-phosphoshikimate 1-carboxyvinyltransferase